VYKFIVILIIISIIAFFPGGLFGANSGEWQSVESDCISYNIIDIVVSRYEDTRHIYAASSSGGLAETDGIYKSTDDGLTWERIDLLLDGFPVDIEGSEQFANILMVNSRTEVRLSMNATYENPVWERRMNGLPEGAIFDNLAIDQSTISGPDDDIFTAYVGYVYPSQSNKAVSKTVDGGLNWTETGDIPTPERIPDIDIHPLDSDYIVFAAYIRNPGIYLSRNSGNTWERIRDDDCYSVAFDPNNPDIIIAGRYNEIVKTIDGGDRWEVVYTSPSMIKDVIAGLILYHLAVENCTTLV